MSRISRRSYGSMKIILVIAAMLCLFAMPIDAQTRAHNLHNGRVNIYHHDGFDRGIRVWRFDESTPSHFREHFPFGPGGIEAGQRNLAPRSPEDIPACYYDADGKLFFARPDRYCAPDWNNRAARE